MRKVVVVGVLALAAGGAAVAMPAGAQTGTPEGCVLATGTTSTADTTGNNVGGESCSYAASVAASYGGQGTYDLQVWSADPATDLTATLLCEDNAGSADCLIAAGNFVIASVGGQDSPGGLAVGSPTGDDFVVPPLPGL